MTHTCFTVETKDKVAHIQLKRPDVFNSMNRAFWNELPDIVNKLNDDASARATLTDGDNSVTLLFAFDERGLIRSVSAEGRGRTVGDRIVRTPWQGRFWNYEARGGMKVPLDGEVAWLPPGGEKPYWRGHTERIGHEFAR